MRDIDVPDLTVDELGTFDVVLSLGVFYHLYDPIDGLRRAASLANDVLVVETHIDLRWVGRPAMLYYPGSELSGDATNWWGPNVPLIRALLTGLGFVRIDIVTTGTRAIVHAWRRDRLRAPGWAPPKAPRQTGHSILARAARVISQRYELE